MKIVHTVSSFGKESYGLGSISMGLAKAQFDLGEDVYVWSNDSYENIIWASETYNFPQNRLLCFQPVIPFISTSYKEIKASYKDKSFDIVHQHSLWTSKSIVTSLLRNNGSKSVIAAHGTLSEFALNKSKFKKSIALSIFEHSNLRNSDILHATSEYEIEDFRRLGLTNPIAYIENGIGSKILEIKGNGVMFREKYKLPKGKKILLYLSRITPKKGLDMLISSLVELGNNFKEWILVIVGNDEFNYQIEVMQMIEEFNLRDKVFIVEPQYGNAKFDAFDASDFFILPSYSEGSPMVIVDALAYGLPVITTKSSSWMDLNSYKCGFWVDIDKSEIKNALDMMLNLNDEQLIQYSINAKRLVKNKYLWDEISTKTVDMYQWILSNNHKPNFIY